MRKSKLLLLLTSATSVLFAGCSTSNTPQSKFMSQNDVYQIKVYNVDDMTMDKLNALSIEQNMKSSQCQLGMPGCGYQIDVGKDHSGRVMPLIAQMNSELAYNGLLSCTKDAPTVCEMDVLRHDAVLNGSDSSAGSYSVTTTGMKIKRIDDMATTGGLYTFTVSVSDMLGMDTQSDSSGKYQQTPELNQYDVSVTNSGTKPIVLMLPKYNLTNVDQVNVAQVATPAGNNTPGQNIAYNASTSIFNGTENLIVVIELIGFKKGAFTVSTNDVSTQQTINQPGVPAAVNAEPTPLASNVVPAMQQQMPTDVSIPSINHNMVQQASATPQGFTNITSQINNTHAQNVVPAISNDETPTTVPGSIYETAGN